MEKILNASEREELAEILEQCLSQRLDWSEGTEPSPPVQPYPNYAIALRNDASTLFFTWQGKLVEADTLKFLDTEDLALYRHLATLLPAPDALTLILGAVEDAEGFYIKCGFSPFLFVQTKPPYTLADLQALNLRYPEVWSYDDGTDIRVMLDTRGIDRELQRSYEAAFPGCSTQTVFIKRI